MMKKRFIGILSGTILLSAALVQADDCVAADAPTVKCYSRRSDSRHKYIQMINSTDKTHLHDVDAMYGKVQATVGYRASFRSKEIAECFFGGHLTQDDCCGDRAIKIQGSNIVKRDPKAWLADYFYLPRNYNGSFSVDPKIKTFFADFDLYVGLDEWMCGMYFRLHGPVVHSKWDLNFCDNVAIDGATPLDHPHGYFSPSAYEGNLLVQSFTDYAKGGTPAKSTNVDSLTPNEPGNGVGVQNSTLIFNPLKYAKIVKCSRSETGFADLRAELGWNFWQSDCYHLGVNLQFAAPTGKKKEPCFLFDAMIGNGNHWEFGGGVTGHYNFWLSEDNEQSFSFHLDANITHLFKERRRRTFDLRNKPNSAYMLAAKHGPNGDEDPPGDQISHTDNTTANALSKQFTGEYAPVANLSTVNVDVSVGVQADVVAMFNYTCGNFSWDIGYNFWGRSCEKIECPEGCNNNTLCDSSQRNMWALKGDSRMFGYLPNTPPQESRPLAVSQKKATILNGTNLVRNLQVVGGSENADDTNRNVDNVADAFATGSAQLVNVPGATTNISLSNEPCFLKCADIDLTRTRGISHTIFTNLGYTWERECWSPYFGVGLSAEFASNNRNCDDDISNTNSNKVSCGPCIDCAVSQWGIWVSGGVAFN